ncbi:MAG: LacI family transcriptional regulator [Opitutaceae bacterium]|jgi:DNA-binding LacI/PurR family transcriptional regulator|nr:LacI family transcriptional regulator [Opitutaceae bacterium]
MLIADIAKKANVSPATVSRAINQPQIVAPERLARIRAVMQECNYEPAPLHRRRGPKHKQVQLRKIGVWFSGAKTGGPGFDWFRNQLSQIQEDNPRYRVDLSVLFTSSPREYPRALAEDNFDGLIIQGLEPAPEVAARLGKIPCVWFMTRRSTAFRGDYVEPDNEANGRMAAEYLRSRGHTSVAVIATDPTYSAIARRAIAFRERALQLGLIVHAILGQNRDGAGFLEIPPSPEEITTLVKRYLSIKPKAGGLYIPSDCFCGMIFRALREQGRQPDQDYEAILGHYTPDIYHNLDHSPAALDINLTTLVRKVVDHLLWRIENPGSSGRIGLTVSPTLILPSKNKA